MNSLQAKIAAARAVGSVVRRSGRGGGTSLPGKVLIRLEPAAIARLAGRLAQGSAVISATNGKTTTATLAASILEHEGRRLVHNRAGANMAGGIASTLLASVRRGGRMSGELGLFEVDEFWLERMVAELEPKALVLCNLFRDQLDRYGELESIADRWALVVSSLPPETRLVLNADDPLIADLGRERAGVTYFGIGDERIGSTRMQHAADSKHCRNCGSPYAYETIFLGHLGVYRCPTCGRERPEPWLCAREIALDGTRGASFQLRAGDTVREVRLRLPGLYNVYNALAAAGLCLALGTPPDTVGAGLQDASAAFGRAETVQVGAAPVSILLMKNPAGANEILRTLTLEEPGLHVLGILNDLVADGRDISWIWDADFELLADRVARVTCAGTRAAELALRLKYAGVPTERLNVIAEIPAALDDALGTASGSPLFALPTYTALLALREELSSRGHAARYWADDRRAA